MNQPRRTPAMEARTVMVVDDSATTTRQLSRILEGSGRYRVVATASDGLDAIRLFKEKSPEIVCMHIVMPKMDGVAALRVMKQVKADTRIIMISSMGGVAEKVAEVLKAGAANILSKPFEADKVLHVLDDV